MATTIVNAVIVLPEEAGGPRLSSMRFDQSRILDLHHPPHRGDKVLDLGGRFVYPGLINAHDHLELNHFPRTKFRDVYTHARYWSADFQPVLDDEPFASLRRKPLDYQCRMGGLKNIRSGVTTVAHHNPLHKPLRRSDFVVRVVQRYGWAHSLYLEPDVPATYRRTPRDAPWMIHLAEGTDEVATSELRRLDKMGCLHSNTVMIHGVGLREEDQQHAIIAGAGLVWCPSSNFYLLGQTAQVGMFARVGLLALGTDSRLTATGDMLDELKAAHATGQLTPQQLFQTVTTDAARLLRIANIGALLPGYLPDFFIASKIGIDPYQTLIELGTNDIDAVYIGGTARYERTAG
jgi:cytosine/adenosine deaminase-related metal-dependent hydrolase